VNEMPRYPPPAYPPPRYQPAPLPPSEKTNTLAIVSFILAFFVSLGAVITGHLALSQITRTRERGRGLAIAGVVIGYIGLAGGIVAILTAIAIPVFLNQRAHAWDASVKSDLANAAIAAAHYSVDNDGTFDGTPPLSIELLESSYGLAITPGNTLTIGPVTDTSYVIIGSNEKSGAGHTFTLTTGTISGPD
jgi:Domain of unknown function (DUF4190)